MSVPRKMAQPPFDSSLGAVIDGQMQATGHTLALMKGVGLDCQVEAHASYTRGE